MNANVIHIPQAEAATAAFVVSGVPQWLVDSVRPFRLLWKYPQRFDASTYWQKDELMNDALRTVRQASRQHGCEVPRSVVIRLLTH